MRSIPGATPSEAARVELDGARAGKTAPMELPYAFSPATRAEIAPPMAPMTPGSPCKLWTRKRKGQRKGKRERKTMSAENLKEINTETQVAYCILYI